MRMMFGMTAMAVVLSGCSKQAEEDTPRRAAAVQAPNDIAKAGKIVFATSAIYPPYSYMNGNAFEGIDIDVARAVAAQLGVDAEFRNVVASSIMPGVQSGRYDAGIGGIADKLERQKVVDFVDFQQTYPGLLVTKSLEKKILGWTDICGHSAAVTAGTQAQELMEKASADCTARGAPQVRMTLFPDHASSFLAVRSKRAELGTMDILTATHVADRAGGEVVVVNDRKAATVPQGIVVSKSDAETRKAVLEALERLYADGTMKRIFAKWNVTFAILDKPGVNLAK